MDKQLRDMIRALLFARPAVGRVLALLLLGGCALPIDATAPPDGTSDWTTAIGDTPELSPIVDTPLVRKAGDSDVGSERILRPLPLPGDQDDPGEGADFMDPADVAFARRITEGELLRQGYTARVPADLEVVQMSVAELGAFGRATPTRVYLGRGELCDRPPEFEGRLVGWVLSHEMVHCAGFEHSREMTQITQAVYQAWLRVCPDSAPAE